MDNGGLVKSGGIVLGKNKHAIKDSEDFVKKSKDLEAPPPRKTGVL